MIIHFICRGNAFRSIMAEAYTKSLDVPELTVISSGTAADYYKRVNVTTFKEVSETIAQHIPSKYIKPYYAEQLDQALLDSGDATVFMNEIVYQEALRNFDMPQQSCIWNIADVEEVETIPKTAGELADFRTKTYHEIVKNVDTLIQELF